MREIRIWNFFTKPLSSRGIQIRVERVVRLKRTKIRAVRNSSSQWMDSEGSIRHEFVSFFWYKWPTYVEGHDSLFKRIQSWSRQHRLRRPGECSDLWLRKSSWTEWFSPTIFKEILAYYSDWGGLSSNGVFCYWRVAVGLEEDFCHLGT